MLVKDQGCLFCDIPKNKILIENELALAISDGFPVKPQHSLVIPKRHIEDYFNLTEAEILACNCLLHQLKRQIQTVDLSVVAFNIGVNAGEAAGQTIFHCHIHLIPRSKGDVANPRGGIRNIIAGKGNY